MECARAAGAVAQRLLLRELDEVGNRMNRKRRVHHQHERHVADERRQSQILPRIVRQLLVQGGIHRQRPAGRHHDGVAVGRAPRDLDRRRHRAGAGPVLDHERLAEAIRQLLTDQPAQNVGAAAGSKRHHEVDLTVGIVLRVLLRPRRGRGHAEQREACKHRGNGFHLRPSRSELSFIRADQSWSASESRRLAIATAQCRRVPRPFPAGRSRSA